MGGIMDSKLPGCVVGRGYPDRLQQSDCGEGEKMATRSQKLGLRYGILALAAVVLVGVVQLDAGEATTRPAARPGVAVVAPKVYNSLGALLSEVPRKLTAGVGGQFSLSQSGAINAWFGGNVPRGSMLVVAGNFSRASEGPGGITLAFKYIGASIHGKKITLRATAYLNLKFSRKVKALTPGKPARYLTIAGKRRLVERGKPGTPITVHGKISQLALSRDELRLYLTDCGFGKIPPPKRPSATTKPKSKSKPKPKSRSPERRAAGKLKLANLYLQVDKKAKAIEILKQIVADYPDTNAAKTAAEKLRGL